MTTPAMISHERTSNEMAGLHTLIKRSSGPNTKKYFHQIQVDAKGFSRPPNAYDPPNTIDFLPHNLSVILIKWHPQPAIRVSWLFTSKMPCEAFQIMYHPIASRYVFCFCQDSNFILICLTCLDVGVSLFSLAFLMKMSDVFKAARTTNNNVILCFSSSSSFIFIFLHLPPSDLGT